MLSRTLFPVFMAALAGISSAQADEALRVERLQRCDDLLGREQQAFCLGVRGLTTEDVQVKLDGKPLSQSLLERDGQ